MNKKRLYKALSKKTDETFRPLFHFSPPVGWLNDPNGFCFFDGKYHLFYQHNPYSSHWGKMHWGHADSADLISWHNLPIALFPDTKNDNFFGCFSGSAIEKNGKLYLMYTGVPFLKQHQVLAESIDALTFIKHEKPVISSENRPPLCGKFSFRDPKIIEKNGGYFACIGAAYGKGRQIALYSSIDLSDWKFVGSLIKEQEKTNGIFECPDLIEFADTDLLIYSIMYTETRGMEYQNIHSSVYLLGKTDWQNGVFTPSDAQKELDSGCDFYAPQTTKTPDGRTVMIAWMQNWLRSNPTSYLGHGWAGAMTLPRELQIQNGVLFQKPVREIYNYFDENKVSKNAVIDGETSFEGILGEVFLLKIWCLEMPKNFGIYVRKASGHFTYIGIADGILSFDRTQSGHKIKGSRLDGDCNVRRCDISEETFLDMEIFVDTASVEIFVNRRFCMSSTIYPIPGCDGISFDGKAEAEISFSLFNSRKKFE